MVGCKHSTVAGNRIDRHLHILLGHFDVVVTLLVGGNHMLTLPYDTGDLVEVDIGKFHLEAHAAVFAHVPEHRSSSIRIVHHLELCGSVTLVGFVVADFRHGNLQVVRSEIETHVVEVSHFDVVVAGCVAVFVGVVEFQVQRTVGRDRVCRHQLAVVIHLDLPFCIVGVDSFGAFTLCESADKHLAGEIGAFKRHIVADE